MPSLGHVYEPYDADKLAPITWRDVTKTSLLRKMRAKFTWGAALLRAPRPAMLRAARCCGRPPRPPPAARRGHPRPELAQGRWSRRSGQPRRPAGAPVGRRWEGSCSSQRRPACHPAPPPPRPGPAARRHTLQMGYTLGWCMNNMPGFSYFKIYGQLLEIHAAVNAAVASGDLEAAKDVGGAMRAGLGRRWAAMRVVGMGWVLGSRCGHACAGTAVVGGLQHVLPPRAARCAACTLR
jgi:hypothetical protein